ncbi:MAG: cytidine deaminase [Candidatus Promineifilaceae bacterium]|nr:cytidine deaminase [Candidatus Promineifilaceae bacterium]
MADFTVTPEQRSRLEAEACASRADAYAPYSHFRVGAAVLAGSGAIYTGANIENAAYSPTICAERVAIFKAVNAGERRILAVAVCTDNAAAPCGPCRQVMREFGDDMVIYIAGEDGGRRETSLKTLLPDSFGPKDLETDGERKNLSD